MLFQRNGNKKKTGILKTKNKERKCSHNKVEERCPPIAVLRRFSGKVSFCTSEQKEKIVQASIAVETLLVLPIFFLGMVTIISFMDIYAVQTEHIVELCEKVKTAGMYAYVLEDSGPEEITFPDVYFYEPVGGFVTLPKVWMYNLVTVHAWTGKSFGGTGTEEEEIEEMVYVTESGGVYHKDLGCSYLNVSVRPVSGNTVEYLKNDYGNYYHACTSCSRGQDPAAVVYITEKGDSYHNQEACSNLKRSVRMVKSSCTDGMAACSRCG